jgi:methyltransferase-like protein/SAM-dependent methyltransferase
LTPDLPHGIFALMADAYDEIAYPGHSYPDTHPDRLATIAHLLGVDAASPERCNVLELGTGDGANLVPLAYALPGSTFIGIDRACQPIERGKAMAAALGLGNVRLECADLMAVTPEIGTFDYIIAHGLFSWVPEPVRLRVLAICQHCLAPNGVAFISYLALPGSHVRSIMRDMMLFHTRNLTDSKERVRQASALAQVIGGAGPEKVWSGYTKAVLDEVREADDSVLFHDYLAEYNGAYYFMQFGELAGRHGLQFLSEAEYPAGFLDVKDPTPQVTHALESLGSDPVLREQYYDFIRCRRFRQTLLVRSGVTIQRDVPASRVAGLHVISDLEPVVPETDLQTTVEETFTRPGGGSLLTDHRVARAALRRLARVWPATMPAEELLDAARADAGRSADTRAIDREALFTILLRSYERGHLDLRRSPIRLSTSPGERPQVSPVARYQLERRSGMTNLRHHTIKAMDDLGATLIRLLDGTRDRQAILADLLRAVASGQAELQEDGRKVTDEKRAAALLAEQLEDRLNGLAKSALLV